MTGHVGKYQLELSLEELITGIKRKKNTIFRQYDAFVSAHFLCEWKESTMVIQFSVDTTVNTNSNTSRLTNFTTLSGSCSQMQTKKPKNTLKYCANNVISNRFTDTRSSQVVCISGGREKVKKTVWHIYTKLSWTHSWKIKQLQNICKIIGPLQSLSFFFSKKRNSISWKVCLNIQGSFDCAVQDVVINYDRYIQHMCGIGFCLAVWFFKCFLTARLEWGIRVTLLRTECW